MATPLLSAIMLVYNGESFVRESILSVLDQTFSDFEFIIINDGSIDRTANILAEFSDSRIKIIHNAKNSGIPYSRNLGLALATGQFLAWCDSDDINLPTRFEDQINFLLKNPGFGACGSWQVSFGTGIKGMINKTPTNAEKIRSTLLFKSAIMNPTSMFRLDVLRKYNLSYNLDLSPSDDYEFFLKCSNHFPMANLKKVLVKYRISETSVTQVVNKKIQDNDKTHKQIYSLGLKELQIDATEKQLTTHRSICSYQSCTSRQQFTECYNWLIYLKEKNKKVKAFDENAFNQTISNQFYYLCSKSSCQGLPVFVTYMTLAIKEFKIEGVVKIGKLLLRSTFKYGQVKDF